MVELVLVVAVAETGVIGDGEAIPWTYPCLLYTSPS